MVDEGAMVLKLAAMVSILCSVGAGLACFAKEADFRKSVIEAPLKREISLNSAPLSSDLVLRENPKVSAGLVTWHQSFEAARRASLLSGKPLLLFQMLGRLDDRFC